MRTALNVCKTVQTALDIQFSGDILYRRLENHINFFSISVFDKILTAAEASGEIADDGSSMDKAAERDLRLHSFCKKLYKATPCYKAKHIGIGGKKIQYKYFSDVDSASLVLKPKPYFHSDSRRFILVLPDCDAIYFESADFTHHVYYRDEKLIANIKNLAIESGLYVL